MTVKHSNTNIYMNKCHKLSWWFLWCSVTLIAVFLHVLFGENPWNELVKFWILGEWARRLDTFISSSIVVVFPLILNLFTFTFTPSIRLICFLHPACAQECSFCQLILKTRKLGSLGLKLHVGIAVWESDRIAVRKNQKCDFNINHVAVLHLS